jgi:hypothetical protein
VRRYIVEAMPKPQHSDGDIAGGGGNAYAGSGGIRISW